MSSSRFYFGELEDGKKKTSICFFVLFMPNPTIQLLDVYSDLPKIAFTIGRFPSGRSKKNNKADYRAKEE